jgi:hypothetical protein
LQPAFDLGSQNPILSRQIFVAYQQFFINSAADLGQQAGSLHFLKLSPLILIVCCRAWDEAEFYPGKTCESRSGDCENRTPRLFSAFQFF